jgi:hypothetical protein
MTSITPEFRPRPDDETQDSSLRLYGIEQDAINYDTADDLWRNIDPKLRAGALIAAQHLLKDMLPRQAFLLGIRFAAAYDEGQNDIKDLEDLFLRPSS